MPWRNRRKNREPFMKSMGWTDTSLFQTLDSEQANCSAIDRCTRTIDSFNNDDVDELRPAQLPAKCCVNCFCDCAARKTNLCTDNKANKIVPHRCEYPNRCAKACKYKKPRTCLISGGIELVPLLARRRAMQRPISLSTTDVTKCSAEKKSLKLNAPEMTGASKYCTSLIK